MKKFSTLLMFLLFTIPVFSQYDTDIIVYIEDGNIAYYDFGTFTSYTGLLEVGPTPNHMITHKNHVILANSGEWGANTSLQIIPEGAFFDYTQNQDLAAFQSTVKKVMLTDGGNAWSVVGIDDSLVVVSLAVSGKLEVVNFITGEISRTMDGLSAGNPQGLCKVDDQHVAVAMADWSDPNLGQGTSVAIYNIFTGALTETVPTHINAVDVVKLEDNNLLALAWGSWFGDDNYGTLHYINGTDYNEILRVDLPDAAKANYVIPVDANFVYVNGFDAAYNTVYGLFNLNTLQYQVQTDGLFANTIVGKLNDNSSLLVHVGDNTEIHNPNMSNIYTIETKIGCIHTSHKYSTSVPVELVSFSADFVSNKIVLNWTTATEINNSGFEVERSEDGKYFTRVGFVDGNGSTSEISRYSFTDQASGNKLYYRLKQVDFDGSYEYSEVVEVSVTPASFVLEQNYPNPFNPATKISFELPANAEVQLSVFNIIGQEVAIIVNSVLESGRYQYTFNASNLTSGLYFYTIKASGNNSEFVQTRKMMLVK